MDAKDVFHYDENWNYFFNCPKEEVKYVEAIPVHEEYEVDTTNNYGEFSKLVQEFKKDLKAELKKETPDTSSIVETFTSNVSTLVSEKSDMFGSPKSEPPTGELVKPDISPNYSGGPIPGKNYDIPDTQSFEGEDEEPLDEG
jgi:hypothetical protein